MRYYERYYSLVLGYAEGGTLGKYLRDDTISFKWENQLKFAKEIASAISWLHDDVGIIHGDLVKCWQHDPHERPEIDQIISELNNIEPLVVSYDFSSDTTKKSESEEVNVPSYDCDINKYNL
ncbi:unnamed protein product [Rhizophagus irregularis]|nr:unnamed protein product [Rhizophagus irregularis]